MQSTKLMASFLTLSAFLLCPEPAQAQVAPANQGFFARIGKPTATGDLKFTVLARKPDGTNFKAYTTTDGVHYPSRPVLEFPVEASILQGDTAAEKANKIRDAFYAQIARLDVTDRNAIKLKMFTSVNHDGELVFELLIHNGSGHILIDHVVNKDKTGEKDEWSKLKKCQHWLDGGMTTPDQFPDDNESMGALHSEDPMYAANLTDGTSVTFDLSGTPAGGIVHVEAGGEHLFSVDTSPYSGDLFGTFLLEMDIAYLMNEHPLIETELRESLLWPDSDNEENPFDGYCVEIVEMGHTSYAIQVEDIGLTLRSEIRFEDERLYVGTRYCEATPNSTGSPSNLWVQVDADMEGDALYLQADRVPNQFGLFFAGPNQIQLPFGDGFRCVGGSVKRLTAPQIATDNQASAEIDTELLPSELSNELNIQYWGRDPHGGGANFNLSDAVNVVL